MPEGHTFINFAIPFDVSKKLQKRTNKDVNEICVFKLRWSNIPFYNILYDYTPISFKLDHQTKMVNIITEYFRAMIG